MHPCRIQGRIGVPGLYVRVAFPVCKTGFFWAVILPALYFGSVHLYQGHDLLSALAAFGVTFIGALYFSWMYVEWNFNIWIPVGLHLLMNGAWSIFTMEGTEVAAGGWISNIARIISIALAIALTVYYRRKRGEKVLIIPFGDSDFPRFPDSLLCQASQHRTKADLFFSTGILQSK